MMGNRRDARHGVLSDAVEATVFPTTCASVASLESVSMGRVFIPVCDHSHHLSHRLRRLERCDPGRIVRMAGDIFSETNSITKIEIYLLEGSDSQPTVGEFNLRGNETGHPVFGITSLTGSDLISFLELWGQQEAIPPYAQCHDPAYGFRGYSRHVLIFETAICWSCGNFSFAPFPGSTAPLGFRQNSEVAQALLQRCDRLLPYHRRPATD
jgi:hypothetical protein